MENRDAAAAGDPLLGPFVAASTEEAARPLLSDLLARAVLPLVRDVVRGHVALRDGGAPDGEDVEQTVIVRLAQHLWRQRDGAEPPIANLAAYVTRTASNACYEHLRARRPQRARLQARLRYLFRHDPSLAIWERRDGGWACGGAGSRGEARILSWPEVAAWRGRLAVPAGDRLSDAARLVRLAHTIVAALGAPARLEDVVTLAADALGVVDDPEPAAAASESGEFVPSAASLADATSAVDVRLDQRRFLERVWAEIGGLPVRQRAALLLNLAGPASQDMLSLLPATGVASWDAIAQALEMDPHRLRALVPGLPHDDHAIARLLQVTRRQVINLRKCARERLARRLGLGIRGGGRAGR